MFSHVMLGANDLEASRKFYDATLATLGYKPGIKDERGRYFYFSDNGIYILTTPINGEPASAGNGSTIGFAAATPEQANAWHEAGVANGGIAIEDPPGVREGGGMKLYLAYLRDPSGNKICALHRVAA